MTPWTNTDLENIANILLNTPGTNVLGYKISNVVGILTDTTFNGDGLADPEIGLVIDSAIFISVQNTSDTQDIQIQGVTFEAGSPVSTFPNANNVTHVNTIIKCATGATALIIYQYRQILP